MADQYVFCEGSMQKKEAKGKWVTYYCVLRGDRLWCFSNRDTNNPTSLVGSIKMTKSTQLKKHKTKDGNYQFKIRNDRGEYRFRCSFTSDRDRWLVEIGKCARGDIPPAALNRHNSMSSPDMHMAASGSSSGSSGGSMVGMMMPQQSQMAPQMAQQQQQQPQQMVQQSQMRPQMEVPGMPGSGGSGGGENLLPGQRIALEENRRRQTSFHQSSSSVPSGNMMGSGPTSSLPVSAMPSQLVRGQGSSASIRSIARPGPPQQQRAASPSIVDEYLNQEWFYGRIPRDVAEDYILSYGIAGSFLLRESESSPGCYSLSFKSEHNDVRHYKIVRHGVRYTLTGLEEKSFPNVIEVVQYYVEVNEGWATPLKRSLTGYRKHPNLRDDAELDHSYTSGFDLPNHGGGGGGGGGLGPPAGWDPRAMAGHPGNHFTAGPAPAAVPMPSVPHSFSPGPSKYIPPPPPMDPPPLDEVEYSVPPPAHDMGDMSFCGSLNDLPPPMSPIGSFHQPPPPMDPPPF